MKKLFFLLLTVSGFAVSAQNNPSERYTQLWNKVDSLAKIQQPKSVLTETEKIYAKAKAEKRYDHLIKTLIYKAGYNQTQENGEAATLQMLQKELKELPFPANNIVEGLLAQTYSLYFNSNMWKIRQRTALEKETDDFTMWDIATFQRKIFEHGQNSLKDADKLKQIPAGDYDILLRKDSTSGQVRPTLYDLLVCQYIDIIINNFDHSYGRDLPISFNNPQYFLITNEFANIKLNNSDSLSIEYQTLNLYKQLLCFHMYETHNAEAVIDIELNRLKYLRRTTSSQETDSLYEKALLQLALQYKTSPDCGNVLYELAYLYNVQAEDKQKYRSKYTQALALCKKIEQEYPQSLAAKKYATDLKNNILKSQMSITAESAIIPNEPFKCFIEYQNIDSVHIQLYKLNIQDKEYTFSEYYECGKELSHKSFREITIPLPCQKDYQRYSTEVKIDALPPGYYAMKISNTYTNNADSVCVVTPFFVSNIEFVQIENSGQSQIIVFNRKTGKPISNAVVELMKENDDSEMMVFKRMIADKNGQVFSPFTKGMDNHNIEKIRISYNKDTLVQELHGFYEGHTEQQQQTITLFFTDRAIYRPGQTVYWKGILLKEGVNSEAKLLPNTKTTVQFLDVNYKEIAKQTCTSNEYGSFSGSFTIPAGLLNGTMKIKNEYETQYIRVEEYKRPSFEVNFTPLREEALFNTPITVKGTAQALAGYTIDQATVKYTVIRESRYGYKVSYLPQKQIAFGKTTTNTKGEFSFSFAADSSEIPDNLAYNYKVEATITDLNGETRSNTLNIPISKIPLLIQTSIPKRLNTDSNLTFNCKTVTLSGKPVTSTVNVEIAALKSPKHILRSRLWEMPDTFSISHSEYEKYFPNDVYNNENQIENFEVKNAVSTFSFKTGTNDSTLNLSILKNQPSGWYRIAFNAQSEKGIVRKDTLYVLLQNGKPASITKMDDWIYVSENDATIGKTLVFEVAGGEKESRLMYQIVHNGKITKQEFLTIGTAPEKIYIPVTKEYLPGFTVQFVMQQNNRTYTHQEGFFVADPNKELKIDFITFRNKLQPGENEKWSLSVKNVKGEKQQAEMVAALYDASLDFFTRHGFPSFYAWNWRQPYYAILKEESTFSKGYIYRQRVSSLYRNYNKIIRIHDRNAFLGGISASYGDYDYNEDTYDAVEIETVACLGYAPADRSEVKSKTIASPSDDVIYANTRKWDVDNEENSSESQSTTLAQVVTRKNFSETAFFYPQLRTNEQGEINIEFTIPEALTRWKMLGFAHTKDLNTGNIENTLITQKQIGISANEPRFLREYDTIVFSAKVSSLVDSNLTASAMLRLFNAVNGQSIDAQVNLSEPIQQFELKVKQSKTLTWKLVIPAGLQALEYKLTTQAGQHTDGETKIIPVLSNSILVTETLPFSVRGGQSKAFIFEHLKNNSSKTLRSQSLTLEATSNPVWTAIQALPYLMEYPHECAEQIFSRFYANTLASAVIKSSPEIEKTFTLWKNLPNSNALLSNLEKNQELKQVLLEETPWVLQAENETERKNRLALLFDLNNMKNEQLSTFGKLENMQLSDGSFPWFKGGRADRYITQHIISGLCHLKQLKALDNPYIQQSNTIKTKAFNYLDKEVKDDHTRLKEQKADLTKQQIQNFQIHYLYICSFDNYKPKLKGADTAFVYYFGQAKAYWAHFNIYNQALIALTMHRFGEKETAKLIVKSLKERAINSEEMGMYWKENTRGYFWYQSPIETQALLIELFNEAANDAAFIENMKIWLLKNKQTTNWRTTKATVEAVNALMTGNNSLTDNSKILNIELAGKPLSQVAKGEIRPEPGLGYLKTSWTSNEITKNMADIKVENPNTKGVAWGALYWQYFEQSDKVQSSDNSLKIQKQLYRKKTTDKGFVLEPITEKTPLQVGDLVTVRMELKADRDFEYVHLKDLRAAGFEPTSTLSGYKYQGGLGYYQNIKDASMNFFISYLSKGNYVFEYDLRATHAGEFSNGITSFQCMYAPEFNANTQGEKITIVGEKQK